MTVPFAFFLLLYQTVCGGSTGQVLVLNVTVFGRKMKFLIKRNPIPSSCLSDTMVVSTTLLDRLYC